jgi:tetratricopeptide (TPR) repeat protein
MIPLTCAAARALAICRAIESVSGSVSGPLRSFAASVGLLSDAAAAYLVRGRDSDYAQALDAADRAVNIDPRLAAAWFNYGLAAEALGQYPIAAQAWDQVITLEPNSGWAREAAEKKGKAPKRQSWQPSDEAEFLAAVERGDDETATRVAERSLADPTLRRSAFVNIVELHAAPVPPDVTGAGARDRRDDYLPYVRGEYFARGTVIYHLDHCVRTLQSLGADPATLRASALPIKVMPCVTHFRDGSVVECDDARECQRHRQHLDRPARGRRRSHRRSRSAHSLARIRACARLLSGPAEHRSPSLRPRHR